MNKSLKLFVFLLGLTTLVHAIEGEEKYLQNYSAWAQTATVQTPLRYIQELSENLTPENAGVRTPEIFYFATTAGRQDLPPLTDEEKRNLAKTLSQTYCVFYGRVKVEVKESELPNFFEIYKAYSLDNPDPKTQERLAFLQGITTFGQVFFDLIDDSPKDARITYDRHFEENMAKIYSGDILKKEDRLKYYNLFLGIAEKDYMTKVWIQSYIEVVLQPLGASEIPIYNERKEDIRPERIPNAINSVSEFTHEDVLNRMKETCSPYPSPNNEIRKFRYMSFSIPRVFSPRVVIPGAEHFQSPQHSQDQPS